MKLCFPNAREIIYYNYLQKAMRSLFQYYRNGSDENIMKFEPNPSLIEKFMYNITN